jgi:hypothetical protein
MPRGRIHASDVDLALASARPGTQDLVLERMLSAWARFAPASAARYADLQDDPFLREVAQRTVALTWAAIDYRAAETWATAHGSQAELAKLVGAVARVLGETDPHAALELISRYDGEAAEAASRVSILVGWAGRDFAATQSWLEAQPPGPARDAIAQRLIFLRAEDDPAAAAALADRALMDEAVRRDALASIIRPWMDRDAEAVRSWAATLDPETRRRVDAEIAIQSRDASPD